MRLYCPYCGVPLSDVDGVPTCIPGNMPLSPHLHRRLREKDTAARESAQRASDSSGTWRCPYCSRPTSGADGMTCPECRISIAGLLFELVEMHPHERAT